MTDPARETLETGVLIVGAGPAGLSCALHLAQLVERHQTEQAKVALPLIAENIYVLEKAAELGGHSLSGAVLDPRAIAELVPDFAAQGAPLETPVTKDSAHFLTRRGQLKLPIAPPFLRNHGNYIVSLSKLVKWLGGLTERMGVSIFPGFAGSQLLFDGQRVAGVRTDDKGTDRDGRRKANFQPGYNIRAKVTVLAEGPRGSLTKELIRRRGLDAGRNPQKYTLGVKELWDVPAGRIEKGHVVHTAGWPLTLRQFGGGFLYALSETRLSVGIVAGLDATNPRFDAHNAFQQFKTHPWLRRLLDGGQMIRYGAKTIPEGGYFSIPQTATDGALIIGDSAGFLNSQRLKGIHLAMKSGIIAAETIWDALVQQNWSEASLKKFEERWQTSWIREELWPVRNYHQGFERGLAPGMFHAALQMATGGRGVRGRYPARADYTHMRMLRGVRDHTIEKIRADGKLTFDKLGDVYHSGTHHEEDQPSHLRIADFDICNGRCVEEYGNPCQYFCPAAVYEMESAPEGASKRLKINASNCIHCKTCDIADPYQIITWVCPEGGGGPQYDGM